MSRLAAVLIYAALQGFLIALLARLFGDRRPEHEGRLTLNPFVQVSAWGAAVAALFGVSWIRSVWYGSSGSRLGRWHVALVVVLGLILILGLIPVVDLLRRAALLLPPTGASAALLVMAHVQAIAVASVTLNCLPIPGLIGGGLLQVIRPDRERRLRAAEPICLFLVIGLIVAFGFPDDETITQAAGRLFAR